MDISFLLIVSQLTIPGKFVWGFMVAVIVFLGFFLSHGVGSDLRLFSAFDVSVPGIAVLISPFNACVHF
jgi:hypothetical protein